MFILRFALGGTSSKSVRYNKPAIASSLAIPNAFLTFGSKMYNGVFQHVPIPFHKVITLDSECMHPSQKFSRFCRCRGSVLSTKTNIPPKFVTAL